jgi:Fe-Mn family superoxide dismutase
MYTEKKFNLPELKGISKRTVDEHLKLYAGYVNNLNTIHEIVENQNNPEYARREAFRRQAFEFGGMRNHEIYFSSFEGGAKSLSIESALYKKISEWCGSFDTFLSIFKSLATTRGIGWAMLGYDSASDSLVQYWVDEQHLGHLPGVTAIIALDMWEHSYVADYQPSGKKTYIEDFFENLNWEVVEKRFETVK